jgi:UrcA family protein
MQTLKTRTFAVLGAVLAGAANIATVVHADVPRLRVSYADLDVHSQQGQVKLSHRIGRAAREVCDVDGYDRVAATACQDKATNKAIAELESRGVTLR